MKRKVMFCCSTQNQTANMIPIIQKKVDVVVIFSTDFAKKIGVTDNLLRVLEKRGIKYEDIIISGEIENNLTSLSNKIYSSVEKYVSDEIYINIGGGQKTFTLAFYNAFIKSSNTIMIYSEPNSRNIIEIQKDSEDKRYKISVDLTLDEILLLYGFEKEDGVKLNLNQISKNLELGLKFADFYKNSEIFRKFFLLYNQKIEHKVDNYSDLVRKVFESLKPKLLDVGFLDKGYQKFEQLIKNRNFESIKKIYQKENLFEDYWKNVKKNLVEHIDKELKQVDGNDYNFYVLKDLKDSELESLKNIFLELGGKNLSFVNNSIRKNDVFLSYKNGDFFENSVQAMAMDILSKNSELSDKILSIWSNVKTKKFGENEIESEYDLVFITKFGTLIMIEVKSGFLGGDTAKSKDYGAYKKSGPYGKAAILGPFIKEFMMNDDFFIDWIPTYLKSQVRIVKQLQLTYIEYNKLEDYLKKELK